MVAVVVLQVSGAKDTTLMLEAKITGVVNCAREIDALSPADQVDRGVTAYLKLSINDVPHFDIFDDLHTGADFVHAHVDNRRQCCLVHCAMGVSRSASVVLAYLIKHRGFSLANACLYVHGKRNVVYPNKGFMFRLMEFEHEVTGNRSIPLELLELHTNTDKVVLKARGGISTPGKAATASAQADVVPTVASEGGGAAAAVEPPSPSK